MSMTMKITGLRDVQRKLAKLTKRNLQRKMESIMADSAKDILAKLKLNTPKDTGALEASEQVFKQGTLELLIGPDLKIAPYGGYVEEGHFTRSGSFVQGQFYIQKTAIEVAPDVTRLFTLEVIRLINRS